jgi:hypothetical protein
MMIPESHRRFLTLKCGADTIRHSRRTLLEHLSGTHDLLEAWDAPRPVRLAGLYHSIYGTNQFQKWAWPITSRDTIKGLIGHEAEALVYIFATAYRPGAFFVEPDTPQLRALREIEAANLLEQGSTSKWLMRLAESDISANARNALVEAIEANAELPVR